MLSQRKECRMIKIASVNVNGLGDNCKWKQMFLYFKKSGLDVIMIQESHCTKSVQKLWCNEWGGIIIISNGESNARGTAILFKPQLNVMVNKISKDDKGRMLICECDFDGQEILLANLYFPNNDEPALVWSMIEMMSKHKTANQVIGGDFNFVLDESLD